MNAQRKRWTKRDKDVKCWTADREVVRYGLQADKKSEMDSR
jgi:hypothetical protein